jgi:hypothetical protein
MCIIKLLEESTASIFQSSETSVTSTTLPDITCKKGAVLKMLLFR